QDIELMPQDQDFGFQPPSRLEAVAQHTDEQEANCEHQPQSCSDSVAAVTPADGVFGSDSYSTARQMMGSSSSSDFCAIYHFGLHFFIECDPSFSQLWSECGAKLLFQTPYQYFTKRSKMR